MQRGFTQGSEISKRSLFAQHVAQTEDTSELKRSCTRQKEKKSRQKGGRARSTKPHGVKSGTAC